MTLVVESLGVRFGGLDALADVSFRADAGEVLGVIGPNGAGKSTLLNALTGFARPHTGTVLLDGESMLGRRPHTIAGRGVVRTFQNLELFDHLTVAENLEIGGQLHRRSGALASILRLRRAAADEAELQGRVERVAERLGITAVLGRRAADLPYGYRKQIEVARALMAEPRVLLLDEPAAGLDTGEIAVLAEITSGLRDDGICVIVIEHDMGFVMAQCDRIVVLDFGRLISAGTPAEVRLDRAVQEAYLGVAAQSGELRPTHEAEIR